MPSTTRFCQYGYDDLGRLTSRVTGGDCSITGEDPDNGVTTACNTTVSSESFTYDEVGNRTDLGAVTAAGNRMTEFDGWTISYDADGNTIQQYKPGVYNRQYYWSAEGQLDSLRQDDWFRVHYDYDAFGRVVRRSIGDLNGMSVEEHYLWDGANLVAILDSSFNRISEYVHEPGTIDRPFALVLGSTTPTNVRFIQQDELGNSIGNFDTGTPTQTVSYGTWGSPTVAIDGRNRLLWKGLLWQGDFVRLHYMRNRWYDPEFGRFISEDPLGIAGGINQYAFANSDPVNGIDPSGLCHPRCPAELPTVVVTAPRSQPRDPSRRPDTWWDDIFRGQGGRTEEPWDSGVEDAGDAAVRACRMAVITATGTAALEISGGSAAVKAWRAMRDAQRTARFTRNFHYPIPTTIRAGNERALSSARRAAVTGYAAGVGGGDLFTVTAETIMGEGYDWINYVPVLGVSTGNALRTAYGKCFAP